MTDTSPQIDLNFPLTGKIAVVTGAASGIGSAISDALTAKGATVAVLDINADIASAKAASLGHGAKFFVCDVSQPDSVNRAISDVVAAFGA